MLGDHQISPSAKLRVLDNGAKIEAAIALWHLQQGWIDWMSPDNPHEEQRAFAAEGTTLLLEEMREFVAHDTMPSMTFQDVFYCKLSRLPSVVPNVVAHQMQKYGERPDIRARPKDIERVRHTNSFVLVRVLNARMRGALVSLTGWASRRSDSLGGHTSASLSGWRHSTSSTTTNQTARNSCGT